MVLGQFTVDLSALQAKCDAGWLERWAAEDGVWGVTTVTGDSSVCVCVTASGTSARSPTRCWAPMSTSTAASGGERGGGSSGPLLGAAEPGQGCSLLALLLIWGPDHLSRVCHISKHDQDIPGQNNEIATFGAARITTGKKKLLGGWRSAVPHHWAYSCPAASSVVPGFAPHTVLGEAVMVRRSGKPLNEIQVGRTRQQRDPTSHCRSRRTSTSHSMVSAWRAHHSLSARCCGWV